MKTEYWKYALLFFFGTMILCENAVAQKLRISGLVTEQEKGQPLENIMVTVIAGAKRQVKAYALTDQKGEFALLVAMRDSLDICFSAMGYASCTFPLSGDKLYFKVGMSVKPFDLKEVSVKASRISQRHDTLSYYVVNFSEVQDRTIGDVLKKMPGIEVSKEGEIKYQGLPISKFYIEGMDLLENKYGIATNNISHKSVKTVEILENHQPIKAFEGLSFPENAAINIKLTDAAKSQWIGNLEVGGGGTPFLWNARFFAMRIAPKWQSLNTYKTNNNGENVTDEITGFSMADILNARENRFKPADYIQVKPQAAPELDEKRYLFNKSHLLTTTNGWKLGDEYQLNAQLTYVWNELHADNASRTTYFFEDSTVVTDESESARSLQNELTGRMTLFANTRNFYLKNELEGKLCWDRTDVNTTGDFANRQLARTPRYDLMDNFELIRRFGRQSVTFTSYNRWVAAPQKLIVTRKSQEEYQRVDHSAFFSNTNFAYALAFYRFVLTMNGGFKFLYRDFTSNLEEMTEVSGIFKNDLISGYLNPYFVPQLEYKTSDLLIGIESPVRYFRYRYREGNEGVRIYRNRFVYRPSLHINYLITPLLTLRVEGNLGNRPIDESYFFPGYVLRNYRNLQEGMRDYTLDKEESVSAGFTYRNTIRSCFSSFTVTRTWAEDALTPERSFTGNYIVSSWEKRKNDRKTWLLSGRYSKGIDALHGMVALDVMYLHNKTAMIQDGLRIPYTNKWFSLAPEVNMRWAKWGNLEYRFSYNRSVLDLPDKTSATDAFTQSLVLIFIPTEKCNLKLSGEHYYNELEAGISKNLFMADVAFTYRISQRWELNGYVSNILDQKNYSYTLYDQLTNYDYRYKIRPRNFMIRMAFTF